MKKTTLILVVLGVVTVVMAEYTGYIFARQRQPLEVFFFREVAFTYDVDPHYYIEARDPLDPWLEQAIKRIHENEWFRLYGGEHTLLWQMINEQKLIKYGNKYYYFGFCSGEIAGLVEAEETADCIEAFDPLDPWTKEAMFGWHAVIIRGMENSTLFKMQRQNKTLKYEGKYYRLVAHGLGLLPPGETIETPLLAILAVPVGWTLLGICWFFLGIFQFWNRAASKTDATEHERNRK